MGVGWEVFKDKCKTGHHAGQDETCEVHLFTSSTHDVRRDVIRLTAMAQQINVLVPM